METLPYSIYINKRPLRTVFFIDSKEINLDQLNAIFEYNQFRWGGRYNPIIVTDGITIHKKWIEFLKILDPDVIESFVNLKDELVKQLETEVSPVLIKIHKPSDGNFFFQTPFDGLRIFPRAGNVNLLCERLLRGNDPTFICVNVNASNNDIGKSFLLGNFGTIRGHLYGYDVCDFSQKIAVNYHNKEGLPGLIDFFNEYKTPLFPIQLCSVSGDFPDVEYEHNATKYFTVVIGDSPDDVAYAWNKTFLLPKEIRTQLNQIWIPLELANDSKVTESIKKYLEKLSKADKILHFVSFSLDENELLKIAESMTETSAAKKIDIYNEPQIPKVRDDLHLIKNQGYLDSLDFHKSTNKEDSFNVNEPSIAGGFEDGRWVADLYIQYKSKDYTENYVNKTFFYKVPCRQELAPLFLRGSSRINLKGFPSVIMKYGDPLLKIKLPEESSIFYMLITGGHFPPYYLKEDPRYKLFKKRNYEVETSDKGQYLSGFIDVFSGLFSACFMLDKRYWRKLFNRLSKSLPEEENSLTEEIKNLAKKHKKFDFADSDDLNWLSKQIFKYSKRIAPTGKELRFKDFLKEALEENIPWLEKVNDDQKTIPKEILETSKVKPQNYDEGIKELKYLKEVLNNHLLDVNSIKWKSDEVKELLEGLKRELKRLMGKNILFVGIKPRCHNCGYKDWFKLDEVKQKVRCNGCSIEYTINPEEEWFYKLNTLIETGFRNHGLVPVVLLLGDLLSRAEYSFLYVPSKDIFNQSNNTHLGDLDVACIVDGKFVIGEVKESVGLFGEKDFERILEVAKEIRPNCVIFSSLDKNPPTRLITKSLELLDKELSPLNIKVGWHNLPAHLDGPSPVR